ncbi:YjiH family protein [Nosocomiicoccus ampullae]|uniref:Nucleoside recognition membrane protein YjiH n=2 Tax=Nosocomiicoccus ampullae TaxID=489910 RepID=A0A9Q2CY67_9STAP|nr:nucleoside recognition membrane protein YjiH [Nosocomiicoccus ampullae]
MPKNFSEVKISKETMDQQESKKIWRFFVYSLIGIFIFFIPITIGEKNSIILDHLVSFIRMTFADIEMYYTWVVIIVGAILPFILKQTKTISDKIFTGIKLFGLVIGTMVVFNFGPSVVLQDNIGKFLYNSLAINLSILIPIGGALLALVVDYGLLIFMGVLLEPIMRPIFRTPGRSAIDAVASFVGSYSIGLLITSRVYKEGLYSKRESLIIATGFSTVSVTFMIVIANTLDMMDHWLLYFWWTLIITFLVTAISVRIPPISTEKDEFYGGVNKNVVERFDTNRFQYAWYKTKQASFEFETLGKSIWKNFFDALRMMTSIVPSILAIGFIGLVLAEYTPIIHWLSFIFYPVLFFWPIDNIALIADAATISLIEMFLPVLLVTEAALQTKFIVAVVSVSAIIFLSGLVPAILSTDLKISFWKLMVIWFIRVALTLIITIPISILLF